MAVQLEEQHDSGESPIPIKIYFEIPNFYGRSSVRVWVKQCEKCFSLLETPDEQKVDLAYMCMFDKAYVWARDYIGNNLVVEWPEFAKDLCDKFGTKIRGDIREREEKEFKEWGNCLEKYFSDRIQKFEESTTIAPVVFDENPKSEKLEVGADELGKAQEGTLASEKDEYQGVWKLSKSEGHDEFGLLVSEKAKEYAIVKELDEPVQFKDRTVVLQIDTRQFDSKMIEAELEDRKLRVEVKSVEVHHESLLEALPGDNIGFLIFDPGGTFDASLLKVIAVNGKFPGPTINVTTNYDVTNNVKNRLNENLIITWPGVPIRHASWQDGVFGTNCTIPSGWNWTYNFQVKVQIGSSFYFQSVNLQRAAEGFGAFIIMHRHVDSKLTELLGTDGEELFTSHDDVHDTYTVGLEKVEKYLSHYLVVRQRRFFLAEKLKADEESVNELDDDTDVYDNTDSNLCPSIVFYERNEVERSSFSVNERMDATIENLKWNCNSELLAGVVRCATHDSLKIWFFNNHWYLKQEIRYLRQDEVKFSWDPTSPHQLICWTLGVFITTYNFVWITAVMDNSTAMVIEVIDDSKNFLAVSLSDIIPEDGKTLATAAAQLKGFNCSDHKKIQKFSGHPAAVRCMIFSEDGEYIMSAVGEGYVAAWSVDGSKKKSATFVLAMDHSAVFLDIKCFVSGDNGDEGLCVLAISEIGVCYFWYGQNIDELRDCKPTKVSIFPPAKLFKNKGVVPSVFAAKLQAVAKPNHGHLFAAYGSLIKPSFEKILMELDSDIHLNSSQDGILLPASQIHKGRKGSKALTQVTALDRANADDALLPISKTLTLVDGQIRASVLEFHTFHSAVKIFDPGGSMVHRFYVLHVQQEAHGRCSNLRASLLRRGLCYGIFP